MDSLRTATLTVCVGLALMAAIGGITGYALGARTAKPEVRVEKVASTACKPLLSAHDDQIEWIGDAGRALLALNEAHAADLPVVTAADTDYQAYLDAYERKAERVARATDDLTQLVERVKVLADAGAVARDDCAESLTARR